MQTPERIAYRSLIIEDNIPAAELMGICLKKYDILFETAADGLTGLKMFLDDSSRFHIIFLDIQLPDLDGYEVAKRIRGSAAENASTIPIIAMSGSYTGDVSENSNFSYFLRKPFEFRLLRQIIDDYLFNQSQFGG